jgi:hypothetical protein
MKGASGKVPRTIGKAIQFVERTESFTVKGLYEIWQWLNAMSYHNPVVNQTTQRWFSKNTANFKKVLEAHDKDSREKMLGEARAFYPEANNGEELYIQDGHPEVKTDPQSGKVLTLLTEVDGQQVPDKAKFTTAKDGKVRFVSVYTGHDIPKEFRGAFKPELKDEALRAEFVTKCTDLQEQFSNTKYEIKTYELGAKSAEGLHYVTVYADQSIIDPVFVEDVIYKYFIQE